MTTYEVRDPIYGFIQFDDWEKEIIDHPAFQRLRRIRQLALTDLVYPGAMHTRFEHSLGVMHLATLMFDAIKFKDTNSSLLKEMGYNESGLEKDRRLIRLAALLHDIGHAPFSHASDDVFPINKQSPGKASFGHEDYTVSIIKDALKGVIETHKLNRNYDISSEDVAALITGDAAVLRNRIFWKVLIASQLDADRGDYLLRDSHHTGVRYGIYDYHRLLNTLSLGIDHESQDFTLGVDEDGLRVAESIVFARYQLFTQVYFHKTRRAYDYHLTQVMRNFLTSRYGNPVLPLPSQSDEFLKLDDLLLGEFIKNSQEENCRAIITRDHIRRVYYSSEMPTAEEEQEINKKIERISKMGKWFHRDIADKTWYKLNDNGQENQEIVIINKNGYGEPLSRFSRMAKCMDRIKQIYLYAKPKDRDSIRKEVGI
jgi:hypothetical protein